MNNNRTPPFYCVVCGHTLFWRDEHPVGLTPWGDEARYHSYTYGICSCCGCENGNHDWPYTPWVTGEDLAEAVVNVRTYRTEWLANEFGWQHDDALQWKEKGETISIFFHFIPPAGWSLTEQMKNIPADFQPTADELTDERLQNVPSEFR